MVNRQALSGFRAMVGRDLAILIRRRSELATPLIFYIMVTTLFPLGLSANDELIRQSAPAIIWVGTLLAVLMALDMTLRPDYDSGALEQLLLTPQPLALLLLAKSVALWLAIGIPLAILGPIMGVALGLATHSIPTIVATLALGTPILILIGNIGVSLTIGLRQGAMLISLIVMPLYVPVLIFAARAVDDAADGLAVGAPLWLLAAMLVLSLTLAPLASAGALRTMLE